MSSKQSYLGTVINVLKRRDNFAECYLQSVQSVSDIIDNRENIRSCVCLGVGNGMFEIELIRQYLPNVERFVAVEPDEDSVKELREQLVKVLPNVRAEIFVERMQDFKGVTEPVDLVLICHCLYFYVSDDDRKQLFRDIRRQWLVPSGGRVVIAQHDRRIPEDCYFEMFTRLGRPALTWETVEAEMGEAGFQLQNECGFYFNRDFSNPTDDVVRLIHVQLQMNNSTVTSEQIRRTVQEVYGTGCSKAIYSKFGVFKVI